MEYLILRKKTNLASEIDPGMGSEAVGADRGSVEAITADVSANDAAGFARDDNVLGVTQPMPLTLIEPMGSSAAPAGETESAADPGEFEPTWGIRAVKADTTGFSGAGVRVAVLDTGIDKDHSAFAGINIIGRNFTHKSKTDSTIDPDAFHDTHGHGTHCAGTIAGRNVGGNRIGVAPGIQDLIVGKVLGPGGGSTGTLFTAMNWAIENGAKIISMSLSMDLVGFREKLEQQGLHTREATSRAMSLLIDNVRFFDKFGSMIRSGTAFGRSALVVAATGNQSDRLGNRFGGQPFVQAANYPGDSEDFLAIGALEKTGNVDQPFKMAEFSNERAKLVAPGVDVLSAAAGDNDQALRLDSGTSMATPHVAGVAALWAHKLIATGQPPTTQNIFDKLRESAVVPPGLDFNDVGRGMPIAPQD